jgi:hypothetical protein
MQFLYVGIFLVAIVSVVYELATGLTLGWPVLRRKDAETVRKLLSNASLIPGSKNMLWFYPESGYVSSCGFSPFGTLYYCDYKRNVRIPWWTPLYKEVKAKYAELNAQEKN